MKKLYIVSFKTTTFGSDEVLVEADSSVQSMQIVLSKLIENDPGEVLQLESKRITSYEDYWSSDA